ncbi:MAG: TetR/AcrR family transcriptional regulator [Desulfobacterales bacterium]|nr:TetR/AcrR family transcriptional regulator [Desulfobacterales bacterium]
MQNAAANDRQRRILDTALDLFTRKGYFNTSVHDIQRAADISIGSIYHHFGNKEGIARALYDDLVGQMTEAVAKIRERNKGLHQRGRVFIAYLFEMAETRPAAMNYILYARHREFMPGEKPICSSKPFELIQDMVGEAMTAGEIKSQDPVIASAVIFGGAIRLIHLRLDGVLEKPLPDCEAEVWRCAWRSVAVPE